jgi:hypothetical protein
MNVPFDLAHSRCFCHSFMLTSNLEYDKRTMLRAGKTFPTLFKDDAIMSGSIAKDLCAQVSTDLVKIVPQPGDHECPICSFIVYQPVRMRCGHVYCISCSIKLQSSKKRFCPMCREDVILLADIGKCCFSSQLRIFQL